MALFEAKHLHKRFGNQATREFQLLGVLGSVRRQDFLGLNYFEENPGPIQKPLHLGLASSCSPKPQVEADAAYEERHNPCRYKNSSTSTFPQA